MGRRRSYLKSIETCSHLQTCTAHAFLHLLGDKRMQRLRACCRKESRRFTVLFIHVPIISPYIQFVPYCTGSEENPTSLLKNITFELRTSSRLCQWSSASMDLVFVHLIVTFTSCLCETLRTSTGTSTESEHLEQLESSTERLAHL